MGDAPAHTPSPAHSTGQLPLGCAGLGQTPGKEGEPCPRLPGTAALAQALWVPIACGWCRRQHPALPSVPGLGGRDLPQEGVQALSARFLLRSAELLVLLVAAAWPVTWPDPRPGDVWRLLQRPAGPGLLPSSCSSSWSLAPSLPFSLLPSLLLLHTHGPCPSITSCPFSVWPGLFGPGGPSPVFSLCLLVCPGPSGSWGSPNAPLSPLWTLWVSGPPPLSGLATASFLFPPAPSSAPPRSPPPPAPPPSQMSKNVREEPSQPSSRAQ